MSPTADDCQPFPGPAVLGRGLVLLPGGAVPPEAADWPRLVVDEVALAAPQAAADQLDVLWRTRQPSVVELAVPFADLKAPETSDGPPYALDPKFTFQRERLHYLIWINRYDGRDGPPRWHHTKRALAAGAQPGPAGQGGGNHGSGDVLLPSGQPGWIDGGPRTAGLALPDGVGLVHVHQLWSGGLEPDRSGPPQEDLAPDQLAAVSHAGGPARVLAPAGSGKTRVLTARLRHLLRDRGWDRGTVMALAYNNRAAAEMRERTRDLRGAQVRTLHSLGYEILGQAQGERPRLLDEWEVRRVLDRLVPARHRANEDVVAPYIEAFAEVRAALRYPELVADDSDDVPGFAEIFPQYRDELARMGAIDHDEQIYGAVEVLLRRPDVRQAMQRRCAHVLLDELQDLTPAQLLLVRLLAAPSFDVFGVGDDDQVIYGYAGANPGFLVGYDRYFPGAASHLLEVNYRCPSPVVDAATKLLAHNRVRVPKDIRSSDRQEGADGGHPAPRSLTVHHLPEVGIGLELVEQVTGLLDRGVRASEISVLTRVNAGLLAPQVLLSQAGVPVRAAVDESLLSRTGVKAALAWMRLAMAAQQGLALDGADLVLAARRPPRKLRRGIVGALGNGTWRHDRLADWAEQLDDARQRSALLTMSQDLDRLAKAVGSKQTSQELLVEIRDVVGLGGALGQLDGSRTSPRGGHTDDLNALILVASGEPDPSQLEPWLRNALRNPNRQAHPGEEADLVMLSTVHRVKGLEWPHVIVWDASEGMMPHRLSSSGRELEEERRVFHVAITRASRSVTVLARKDGASPFLDEMTGQTPPPQHQTLVAPDSADPYDEARSDPAATRQSAKKGRGATQSSRPEPRPEDAPLVEVLKAWRKVRADKDKVPAYIVLSDRHLEAVAAQRPTTPEELLACPGIGPTKLDRYGDEILELIIEYLANESS